MNGGALLGKPLDGLCEGVENARCRAEAKGKHPVEEELALPAHSQEMVILWTYGTEAECVAYVDFGHERVAAKGHD